jgi:DNA polymerase-3 subunit gamma/tau
MEKFIVSARKYRPQTFDTVVGQEHITTTLKNAIRQNQLAHAFLFCGPRGVGKTTCARILAKTINCENRTADAEACNTCGSCTSFNDGASLNIHELDAASNNSVEDIRSLVEQVRFAPQAGKYKVYIIDEVHMLSQAAFNAFLKTLEEPPPYAIFILATTEKHKILPTILSRCQIFDFKRITLNDTVTHLQEICDKEKVEAELPALQIIAQKSEGCMRDALSIMDKIVSFTGGHLNYGNTLEHLNILDADYYFQLLDAMISQDLSGALLLYDQINRKGFEGDLVINGFAEFIRNLLVCKDAKAAALLEVVESFRAKYQEKARQVSASFLISALNILSETELNYKAARNKRLHVELALIRLCYLQQAIEITADADKKKRIDSAKPVAFRAVRQIVPANNKEKAESAKKVSETPKPAAKQEPAPSSRPQIPVPASTPTPSVPGKLTGLAGIRNQFKGNPLHQGVVADQPLEMQKLQEAWAGYVEQLRAARNPAAQPFELARLHIEDANSFQVFTSNNIEQKFIEQERNKLFEFLQQQLQNRMLQFVVLVEENQTPREAADIPLSSKEQYQQLVTQYPLIKTLRDRLQMDLDY